MSKRGMSQTVSTLILVLLILIAIGGIWAVLNQTIFSQTSKINLGSLTTELKITKVNINGTNGEIKVRVQREKGGEKIDSIKIIVKDDENSDVYDQKVVDFLELSERSFTININERGIININKLRDISVAPVFILEGEKEAQLGRVTDSFKISNSVLAQINLETGGIFSGGSGEGSGNGEGECTIKSDCGTDYWIDGTQICSQDSNSVMQFKKVYSCNVGFCSEDIQLSTKQACFESQSCFESQCINDPIPCTNDTINIDCGYDDFVGQPICSENQTQVLQNFINYTCLDGFCAEITAPSVIEQCNSTEICFNAECFTPLECSANSDCEFGEICNEGSCVQEEWELNGTVNSIWPFDRGEYFDSLNLPTENASFNNHYIIFPQSNEDSCMNIREYKVPESFGTPYIRLSKSETQIKPTDYFEIWQTNYACSLI